MLHMYICWVDEWMNPGGCRAGQQWVEFKNQRRKPADLHILALGAGIPSPGQLSRSNPRRNSTLPVTSHGDKSLCVDQHSRVFLLDRNLRHAPHHHTPGAASQCLFQWTGTGETFFPKWVKMMRVPVVWIPLICLHPASLSWKRDHVITG